VVLGGFGGIVFVVPTLIANAWFLPHHLLPRADESEKGEPAAARAKRG